MSAMPVQSPSSPIESLSEYRDEHNREEIADHAIPSIEQIHLDEYLEYLNNGAQNKIDFAEINEPWIQIQKDTFLACANQISSVLLGVLLFKSLGNMYPPKHVTDTKCRPDIIAAFEKDFDERHVHAWPQIQLTGEIISKGRNIDAQRRQAALHLYYMILARPDLYVSHGLLLDDSKVTFFAGITGHGIFDISLKFDDEHLRPLLYALIDHIYSPGKFKDNRYISITFNPQWQECEYTLSLQTSPGPPLHCDKFKAIYARNPFETTTYVFTTSEPIMINNRPMRVVKDQYCRATRFDEPEILKHIHKERGIPGVVELLHDEEWETPISPMHSNHRVKRRLGLSQHGSDFMSVKTVKAMLEAAYDMLEVTRYLRFKRNVLHRDLSVGNIIVNAISDASDTPLSIGRTEGSQDGYTRELEICFIKHLLGESSNPQETSTVLIDFNGAERLDVKTDTTHARNGRTGTPLFIARAVHNGGPFPDLSQESVALAGVPEPSPTYQQCHPERIKPFEKIRKHYLYPEDAILTPLREWRHELYHDAESIFWIIFYWFILANPEPGNFEQKVDTGHWLYFIDTLNCLKRNTLMRQIGLREVPLHSRFSPALMLLSDLAQAVYPGPYYMAEDNPRSRPDFVHEVFQRAILNFIIKHKDEDFINLEIDLEFRRLEGNIPRPLSNSKQSLLSASSSTTGSKRPSPVPEHEQDDHETTSATGSKKPRREPRGNPYPPLQPSQGPLPEST
ncbi:hypothetical protein CVT25_010065 [Psilocybe cyanescens]|uniref:Fungal-type protein kinase domain-containing protein n=1 Tax=Psilocybe cyanescens TaxID=93625 RepID=A0A409X3F0_PSICY|nr:hypothetical protein CVT25_010065 [Psilocybe cyanescens]